MKSISFDVSGQYGVRAIYTEGAAEPKTFVDLVKDVFEHSDNPIGVYHPVNVVCVPNPTESELEMICNGLPNHYVVKYNHAPNYYLVRNKTENLPAEISAVVDTDFKSEETRILRRRKEDVNDNCNND